MNELISIILPVYNCQNYISKCIESILNQTYSKFELIIVNDGSTDLTSKKILSFNDKRIKYIEQQNSGVSSARNKGIKNSLGKYVIFVDADDTLEENMLKVLYNKAVENNLDIVRANYNSVIGEKAYPSKYNLNPNTVFDTKNIKKQIIPKILSHEIRGYVWLLLIKKDIINNIEFDTKLKILEDTKFYIEIFNNSSRVMFINDILYNYRCDNLESATKSQKSYMNNIYNMIASTKSIIELTSKFGYIDIQEIKHFVTKNLNAIVNYFYLSYKVNKDFKYIIKFMKELRMNNDFIWLTKYYKRKYSSVDEIIIFNLFCKKMYYILKFIYKLKILCLDLKSKVKVI